MAPIWAQWLAAWVLRARTVSCGKRTGLERVPGGEAGNGRGGQRIPADESKVGVLKECAARLLGEDESVGRVTGAWQRGLNPFLRRVRGDSAF